MKQENRFDVSEKGGNDMASILKMVGILVVITNTVVCMANMGVMGLLIGVPMGLVASLIYFALAEVLENQEQIFQAIRNLEKSIPSEIRKENQVKCPNCQKIHHDTASNCPHCGYSDR